MTRSREIGGYIEFERFAGEPYHKGTIALNSGRGCLAYLVELRGIKTMWVPDFMCDSVPALLRREGVEVRTYAIGEDFLPIYDFEVGPDGWLLLMDYYGQLCGADVDRARAFCDGRLVVDESQGFFRRPWADVDTTYTCRKWFGVADGGYLATGDGARLSRAIPRGESHPYMGFVLGRMERSASEFYDESARNNKRFSDEPAMLMSYVTENIMRGIDYGTMCVRRNANWLLLDEALGKANGIVLRTPECAFMYPLYLGERAQDIRRALIAEKVFVPMLWPNVSEEQPQDSIARRLAEGILPLPVDQRYGEEEMAFIAEEIGKWL